MNPTIERYITKLIEQSSPEYPIWNQEAIKGNKSKWNYVDGCMIKALLDMYTLTKDERFLKFSDDFIGARVHDDGTIDGYDCLHYSTDDINAGKTLFELYDYTGKEKYRKAIDLIYYKHVLRQPRTIEGNFWHKLIYPHQVWLDGLYMAQPFYLEYETRFNGCANYADIISQFQNVYDLMRDPASGLYYHCYDSSKTAFWCNKETGLSNFFWLRAMGWYTMALLDCYEKIDKSDSEHEEYAHILAEIFRDLIRSMLSFQDKSGMWYQIVNQGGRERNYLETSGTSVMAYAIFKGIRLGILPEELRFKGEMAFNGICERYLTETESGDLNLGGICLVAGLGPDNNLRRDGTYDYYMSEPIVENDAKGVAPFLLAYIEVLRRDMESGK